MKVFSIVIVKYLCRSVQHGPQNHLAHMNKLVEFCETGVKEVCKYKYKYKYKYK